MSERPLFKGRTWTAKSSSSTSLSRPATPTVKSAPHLNSGEPITTANSSSGSACTNGASTANLYQFCSGKPRNVASSHSGVVTVALSLQEPTVFLAWAPSSFRSTTSSLPITSIDEDPNHSNDDNDPVGRVAPARPGSQGTIIGTGVSDVSATAGVGSVAGAHTLLSQPHHAAIPGPRNALAVDQLSTRLARSTTLVSPSSNLSSVALTASRIAVNGSSGSNNAETSNGSSGSATSNNHTSRTVSSDTATNRSTEHSEDTVDGSEPPPFTPGSRSIGRNTTPQLPLSTLRGTILLKLAKPTKIKHMSLSFYGVSKTEWAQSARMPVFTPDDFGQPSSEIVDAVVVNSHEWNFLDLNWVTPASVATSSQDTTIVLTNLYGADAMVSREDGKLSVHNRTGTNQQAGTIPYFGPSQEHRAKVKQASSIHKDSAVFPAGEYVFNFHLAIDATVPETLDAPYGSIRYYLQPKVVRSGPFNPNISARQEVELVRSPPNNCDTVFNNPIIINRVWDQRLEYEIIVPRKYIPLHTSIPMSLTFTRHDKVKLHRIKIYLVEIIQYTYSADRSIEYTDTTLRILLEDKKGQTECQHSRLGETCTSKCQRRIVGDLLNEDTASTTFVFDPKLESTGTPIKQPHRTNYRIVPPPDTSQLHPDAISSPYIKVRHRLMMSFRASKEAANASSKRRHFEIRVDTPIVFLSPKCVDENVELPEYAPPSYESHEF